MNDQVVNENGRLPRIAAEFPTPRTLIACIIVLTFLITSSLLDTLRPKLSDGASYGVVVFDALLIVSLWLVLRGKAQSSGQAVLPPDQRIHRKGIDPLLTLRFFACLLVLLGHFYAVVFPAHSLASTLVQIPWYWVLTSSPWAGVWIFFVLSAYLMGKGFFSGRYDLTRSGILRFYTNRLLRIFPVYIVAIVLVVVLKSPSLLQVHNLPNILRAVLFNGASSDVAKPVGALWSISTEFQFYLLAPFLALVLETVSTYVSLVYVVVVVLFVGGVARYCCMHFLGWIWPFTIYNPLVWNLDLFTAGMALSKLVLDGRQMVSFRGFAKPSIVLPLFVVFYLLISWCGGISVFQNKGWVEYMSVFPLLSALFACFVISSFELNKMAFVVRNGFSRVLISSTQGLGILTYCIYVWHEPIFLAVRSNFGPDLSLRDSIGIFAPVIFVTLCFASAAYVLIERPFERRKMG